MKNYTLHVLMVDGFPVKVYAHKNNQQAYIFPLFGRYHSMSSDKNVMDFVTDFLISKHPSNVITFQSYLNGNEDTAVININDLKAS
jgi:hypothetical protein